MLCPAPHPDSSDLTPATLLLPPPWPPHCPSDIGGSHWPQGLCTCYSLCLPHPLQVSVFRMIPCLKSNLTPTLHCHLTDFVLFSLAAPVHV